MTKTLRELNLVSAPCSPCEYQYAYCY